MDAQCELQTQASVPDVDTNTAMQEQSRYAAFKQVAQGLTYQKSLHLASATSALNSATQACTAANSVLDYFRQAAIQQNPANANYSGMYLAQQASSQGSGPLYDLWCQYADAYNGYQSVMDDAKAQVNNAALMSHKIDGQYNYVLDQYHQFQQSAQTSDSLPTADELDAQIQSGLSVTQAEAPNPLTPNVMNDLNENANAVVSNATNAALSSTGGQVNLPTSVVSAVNVGVVAQAPVVQTSNTTLVSTVSPPVATPSELPSSAPTSAPNVTVTQTAVPGTTPSTVQTVSSTVTAATTPSVSNGAATNTPAGATTSVDTTAPSGSTDVNAITPTPVVAPASSGAPQWLLYGAAIAGIMWLFS